MNSKEILKQTVEQPFNEEPFKRFIADFFNDYNVARTSLTSLYPSEHTNKFNLFGEYQDSQGRKIHILEVELKNSHKLENARTAQRNLIAKYLEDNWLDGALVAFLAPDYPRWRFSFVKLAWEFDKENKKTKKILSPAKRYSFLIGEGEPSHTAQSQLLPVLEQEKNPTLEQIEETFNVERITKEFYQEYKKLFDGVCKALEKNRVFVMLKETKRIDTSNFAKKLLGQIVFLYFIQKKGWLGVSIDKKWGEGDRMFLRRLFERAREENKNFFNDYLEILFYNTLNNPRRGEVDPSYSKYFGCKIPFLNGGLFEPMKGYDWENSLLYLDNSLFSNSEGTGILDVFDKYNFTIKEDEPLEKEVAIDPEMLGKVFENLLEENLRKGKGTYYTPREIVHYMCRESLINYLTTESKLPEVKIRKLVTVDKTIDSSQDLRKQIKEKSLPLSDKEAVLIDDILAKIKICDPACGSGAFLVGMLQEIVQVRNKMTNYLSLFGKDISGRTDYELKKQTIQNCIYGVDIDPGAVEIAKLRLWLSLVVDYELEEIEPLPNLDYKIMQGNSLLEDFVLGDTVIKLFDPVLIEVKGKKMKNLFEEEKQKDLFEEQSQVKKVIEQLDTLRKKYFRISDLSEKIEVKKQIEGIEQNLVEQCVNKEIKNLDIQLKNIGQYVVPGVGMTERDAKKLAKTLSAQAGIMEMWREFRESGVRPFFLWHLYFADVFQQKGGFDVVIANPPYVTTKYGKIPEELKRIYIKKFESAYDKLDLYILFIEKAIKISKERGFTTLITPWNFLANFYSFKIRKFLLDNTRIRLFNKLPPNVFGSVIVDNIISIFERDKNNKGSKILFDDLFDKNKRKYLNQDVYSQNEKYVFTFPDDDIANQILQKMKIDAVGLGKIALNYIGIMTGGQKEMIANGPIFKKSRPVLSGKDIIKWKYFDRGNFVNFDKSKIHSNDNEEVYLSEKKILLRKTGRELVACIDKNQFFTIQSLYNIIVKNHDFVEEYLLALLNSKLFTYIYNKFFITNPEVFPYIKRRHLDQLPVKVVSPVQQKPLTELVNKILAITKDPDYLQNPAKQAKVHEYENQIDRLVYKLYGLTAEEIKIIEKSE